MRHPLIINTALALTAILAGALTLISCKDDTAKIPMMPAPPGAVGPTTAEVLAKLDDPVNLADPSLYERIPPLGSPVAATTPDGITWDRYPVGILIKDLKPGTGNYPQVGQTVTVKYVGTFPRDGKEFDRSPADKPFEFVLGKKKGSGTVIKGWNIALSTMKVGGKRKVLLPPDLAYGPSGKLPAIGPNQALIFDLELVKISGDSVTLPAEKDLPLPGAEFLKDIPFGILNEPKK